MIRFFVLSNVAITLFYLVYKVFLQRDTFFVWRRLYMLFALVFSVSLPLVEWQYKSVVMQDVGKRITNQVDIWWQNTALLLNEIVVSANAPNAPVTPWWVIVYMVVVSVLLVVFISRLVALYRLKQQAKPIYIGQDKVWVTHKNIAPFSFFGMIMLNKEVLQQDHLSMLLQHEKAHVRQWHSLDVILAELISVVFFFNPFVYLLKREMRINLEYLADNSCSAHCEQSTAYQYAILQMAMAQPYVAISNHFNYSPIKNRIMMLNKKSSKNWAMLKYVSIVPAVLVLLLLSQESVANKWSNVINDEGNTVEQTIMQTTAPQSVVTKQEYVQNPGQLPDSVFMVVKDMPSFKGGADSMYAFLGRNLKYPSAAKDLGITGRIWMSFVVTKTGAIHNVKILQATGKVPIKIKRNGHVVTESVRWSDGGNPSITISEDDAPYVVSDKAPILAAIPLLSQEATRVVASMPKWEPGTFKGQPVNVQYQIPVKFALSKK